MFCSNCGTQIKENGAFCPNCGNRINNTSAQVNLVVEQPKKAKKRKTIVAIISILIIVIMSATIINKHLGDEGSSELRNNQWYIAERTDNNIGTDYKIQYKYLDWVQLLEVRDNDEIIEAYTYDDNNRLVSMESDYFYQWYTYEEKGDKYVGTSNTYQVDDFFYYDIVHYNSKNQLVLKEEYRDNELVESTKYSYYANGVISQSVNTVYDGYATDSYVETYNEQGNMTLFETYVEDRLVRKIECEFDGNRLIEEKCYNEDGRIYMKYILEDMSDDRVKFVAYDVGGNICGYAEHIYDEKDHLIQKKSYDENNTLTFSAVYVWINMKQSCIDR